MNSTFDEIHNYFHIKELVCPDVYNKFGEYAWNFLDDKLLETLYILRTEILKAPMTVNNWHIKGSFSQRGLRCNRCQLVKSKSSVYMSSHILGKAVDFDAKGLSAEQARQMIKKNADKLPYPIRLEEGVNWVHIDVLDTHNSKKITTFKA